jgi:hypothetical protein
MRIHAVALALLLPACVVGEEAASSGYDTEALAGLKGGNLQPGDVMVWNFNAAANKAGIDPRFTKLKQKNVKNVSFKQGATQQITMTNTNAVEDGKPGQANISLGIADVPVNAGAPHYFKGWLSGNVFDSTNDATGFCGEGNFEKSAFRAQLQFNFMNGQKNVALCYCNICPAKDASGGWCTTDQWQTPTDQPPVVSASGACKAPAGTDHVIVTLEAVAKGDEQKNHHGTAVFRKVVIGRCNNDGICPESMTPNEFGN